MNLTGLTWAMAVQDTGMKAGMDSAQKSLQNVNNLIDDQSKKTKKSDVPGFFDRLRKRIDSFNIGSIASDIRSLTGDTGTLTNSLEGMAVGFAKTAKPFVASLDLTGKQARKMTSQITGMAISMNVGAETVAETFVALRQATGASKKALDALGYSEKDWVKITETTGIKVGDLTDAFGGMGALFKAAPEDEAKFANRLVEIGRAAGLGLSPMKNLKSSLETIGKSFEKLPPGLQRSGKEMMGLVESATRMGGVFRALGSDEEEATKLGVSTAQMFADQAVAIERAMKLGMSEGDMAESSPILKYLTGLGIGFNEAVGIIETGSRDTVQGVQLIQGAFKKFNVSGAQQQAMLSGLSGALGESAAGLGFLVQSGDEAEKQLSRMGKVTANGKFSLRDYANQAFSTGRTLQESFDLVKDSFDTQIRSISRKDVMGLVGGKMGAFKDVAKEIKALGDDKLWGPFVKGMSTFKMMGIQGVALQAAKGLGLNAKAAQKAAVKFGLAFDTLGDFAKEIGPVFHLMGQLGPGGLLVGGVVGFFMLSEDDRKKIMESFAPMWAKIKDFWSNTFLPAAKQAWNTVAGWVGDHWPSWWSDKILPAIISGLKAFTKEGGIGGRILGGLGDVFKEVWKEFGIKGALAIGGLAMVATGRGGVIGDVLGSTIGGSIQLALKAIPWGVLFSPAGLIGSAIVLGLGWIGKKIYDDAEGAANRAREIKEGAESKTRSGALLHSKNVEDTWSKVGGVMPKDRQKAFNDLVTEGEIDPTMLATKRVADIGGIKSKLGNTIGGFAMTATGAVDSLPEGVNRKSIDEALSKLSLVSELPNVQNQLAAAANLSAGELWATIQSINETYAKLSPEQLEKFKMEAFEVQQLAAKALASGVVGPQLSDMGDDLYNAGMTIMPEFGYGLGAPESVAAVKSGAEVVANSVADIFGHSLPTDGPLAGGTSMWNGAAALMAEFAYGIESSTELVKESVTRVLDDSIIATIEGYREKVADLAKNKSILNEIAKAMVRDLGGEIQSTITVDGKQEDVKGNIKAMLNVPGLAGVVVAIITEGARQRALLDKIRVSTQFIADSDLVKKGKAKGNDYVLGS